MGDPAAGAPTQYGTPYYAFANAVCAKCAEGEERRAFAEIASRSLQAAVTQVADPERPGTVSHMHRDTLSSQRINHRDFYWPPALGAYRILRDLEVPEASGFAEQIRGVDIMASFAQRAPSNWASVWMAGEWLRIREGLSPYTEQDFDEWLAPFFEQAIDVELGMFMEHGLPNAYDLFTRYHLAIALTEGYGGMWLPQMHKLMEAGLQRSLDMQLSDGSVAMAFRSAGQTWNLGCQCAYFTIAARYFEDRDAHLASQAAAAAARAHRSFQLWQRPDGPYSPVQNLLPPLWRVGYEMYTADGHYGCLALGHYAHAVLHGLESGDGEATVVDAPRRRTEGAPVFRSVLHRGGYSVHFNARPTETHGRRYDALGIGDITFGSGRFFHFGPAMRHLETGGLFSCGIALREEVVAGDLTVLSQQDSVEEPILAPGSHPASVNGRFTFERQEQFFGYCLWVVIEDGGVEVEETTPGLVGYKSLLVPYLIDAGAGIRTRVEALGNGFRFVHGCEAIILQVEADISRWVDVAHGFENRRGLGGMLRVDLGEKLQGLRWRVGIDQ
jgi:hypothetical protein